MKKSKIIFQYALIVLSASIIQGCNSPESATTASTTTDSSGSITEAAAATVGGAISSTKGDILELQMIKNKPSFELASRSFGRCPNSNQSNNGTCSVYGHTMTLLFPIQGCIFGENKESGPIWIGGTTITTGNNDSVPVCGHYPAINGTSILSTSRGYPGNLLNNPTARTNQSGTQTAVLDTSAPRSASFQSAANGENASTGTIGWEYEITAGGGYRRTFVSPTVHTLDFTIRTVGIHGSEPAGTVLYDHTLSTTRPNGDSTPLTISITGSGVNEVDTVNGTLTVQHNLMRMVASVSFSNTQHPWGCCYPNSGSITTSFTGGVNDGKQETMTFHSSTCSLDTLGQVQFTDITGTTSTRMLTHCF